MNIIDLLFIIYATKIYIFFLTLCALIVNGSLFYHAEF